jgi:hypothetical protein
VAGRTFQGRDYFHGALRHADREGLDRLHVSRVYTSENDGIDKLALSLPLKPDGLDGEVWVLGATITTDRSLGLTNLHDGPRNTILLAVRDTASPREPPPKDRGPPEYVVLVHNGYVHGQKCVPFSGGVLRPATASPDEPELRFPGRGAAFEMDDAFSDPLAATHPAYTGRWLVGSAPVGNSELVVLVEQRYEDAIGPYRAFFRRLLTWLGGLIGVGGLLLLLRLAWLRQRLPATPIGQ